MTRQRCVGAWLLVIAVLAGGCAAGKAFKQGQEAAQAGNLDEAVAAYRRAVQAASRSHLEKARDFESKDQLEAALSEYRLASEYDPSNRLATARVVALD